MSAGTPTSKVRLREMIQDDLPIFFKQQLDPQANWMAAFTAKDPSNHQVFEAHWEKVLSDPGIIIRAILYDSKIAGSVLCHAWGGDPEISYRLGKEFWGKGVATRGLTLFLEVVKARPLYARGAKDNVGSIRVLEKMDSSYLVRANGIRTLEGKRSKSWCGCEVNQLGNCKININRGY